MTALTQSIRLACLFLLTAYAVLVIPGLVLAVVSYAKLGFVELRLDFPAAMHWARFWALNPLLLLEVPLVRLEFAAGLPLSQGYAITVSQFFLSMVFAVVLALTIAAELGVAGAAKTVAGALPVTALTGLAVLAAAAPGLLGHCAHGASVGGILTVFGVSPAFATSAAAASPYLQIGVITILVVRLAGPRLLSSLNTRPQSI